MTTRIHCDADGCRHFFNEDDHAIIGPWRRLEYISDTTSHADDTTAKHFCSLACTARWTSEASLRQMLNEREQKQRVIARKGA